MLIIGNKSSKMLKASFSSSSSNYRKISFGQSNKNMILERSKGYFLNSSLFSQQIRTKKTKLKSRKAITSRFTATPEGISFRHTGFQHNLTKHSRQRNKQLKKHGLLTSEHPFYNKIKLALNGSKVVKR